MQLVAGSDTQIGQVLDETGDFDVHFVNTGLNLPSQLVPFVSGPGAPDGLNAGQIENPDYASKAKVAMDEAGADGCADWNAAGSALYKRADLVPFANQQRVWLSRRPPSTSHSEQSSPPASRWEQTDGQSGLSFGVDSTSRAPVRTADHKGLSHVMIVRVTSSAVCDSTVIRA